MSFKFRMLSGATLLSAMAGAYGCAHHHAEVGVGVGVYPEPVPVGYYYEPYYYDRGWYDRDYYVWRDRDGRYFHERREDHERRARGRADEHHEDRHEERR